MLPSLARVPGLEAVEPAEQDLCCGSAGIYNVVQAEAARELGDRKAANVLATRACLCKRESGLPRPGLPGPPACEAAAAGPPPDRARRRLDQASAGREAAGDRPPLGQPANVEIVARLAPSVRGGGVRVPDGYEQVEDDRGDAEPNREKAQTLIIRDMELRLPEDDSAAHGMGVIPAQKRAP